MTQQIYFAIPGDLNARTGGYSYDRRLLKELAVLGLLVKHLPLANSFPFPDAKALENTEAIFAALPDQTLVIVDGLAFGAMAQSATRHAKRLRLIALCHHPLALESGLSSMQQETLRESERTALQAARAVIVTSATTARTVTELFAIPESKITVAKPGTDRADFAPCAGDPAVLLCVATLTRRKAHDVLIQALEAVADLPWQARFAGGEEFDPTWGAMLRQQIKAAGLESRISLLGSIEDVASEYQRADLFVLPSRYEGFGMVFAEALANGLPVVAARAGAVPDVVPETAGLLVPPDDSETLAHALRTLLSDRHAFAQLRAGAQNAGRQLLSWQDTANAVHTCIENIINETESVI